MSVLKRRGNDLATVTNSAICVAFLSVKQLLLCKGSTIYRMKGETSVFYFCFPSNFPIRITMEV